MTFKAQVSIAGFISGCTPSFAKANDPWPRASPPFAKQLRSYCGCGGHVGKPLSMCSNRCKDVR